MIRKEAKPILWYNDFYESVLEDVYFRGLINVMQDIDSSAYIRLITQKISYEERGAELSEAEKILDQWTTLELKRIREKFRDIVAKLTLLSAGPLKQSYITERGDRPPLQAFSEAENIAPMVRLPSPPILSLKCNVRHPKKRTENLHDDNTQTKKVGKRLCPTKEKMLVIRQVSVRTKVKILSKRK